MVMATNRIMHEILTRVYTLANHPIHIEYTYKQILFMGFLMKEKNITHLTIVNKKHLDWVIRLNLITDEVSNR